jgi:predicted RNase H-like nuclease
MDTDTDGLLSPGGFTSFEALIAAFENASAIGVDMPIGLGTGQARGCDTLARRMLRHRHMTVFTPPARRLIEELYGEDMPKPNDEDVIARSWEIAGQGISKQAIAICPKIAEVDRVMTPALQRRVFEVHPEVCFCSLAGRPVEEKKDGEAGYERRRELLANEAGWKIWSRAEAQQAVMGGAPDDLLDAAVAAWTAVKVTKGLETRLTGSSELDARGLRMEIVY